MKELRKAQILEQLEHQEHCTVADLALLLNVTPMSVRRYINELSKEGLVLKGHGSVKKSTNIKTVQEKINAFSKEKKSLGILLNQHIKENDIIFIGAGTTYLHACEDLTKNYKALLTTNLPLFQDLHRKGYKNIFLTGGELFPETEEFFGQHSESLIEKFNIDTAFIATNGIINNSITTSNPLLGRTQEIVMKNAKKSILLVDHSKFNKSDMYISAKVSDLFCIITDTDVSQEIIETYSEFTQILY